MKMPPPEKIYEAWSALAAGRFSSPCPPEAESGTATVISSGRNKEYNLRWAGNICYSNDPASWWQSYPGYPVLTLLMYRRLLPYDEKIAALFASVPWVAVNKKAKRDYAAALAEVFSSLNLDGSEQLTVRNLAESAMVKLAELPLVLKRLPKSSHAAEKS